LFKYPKQFVLHAIGGIVYNTTVIFGAVFLGKTIDAANLVNNDEAPLSLFYLYLFAFIASTIFFQLARYVKRLNSRAITNLMNRDIRTELMASILNMPMSDLRQEKIGDLMSRIIGDVEQVSSSVLTTVREIWDTILLILSYFVACMLFSPKITLLASIPIPIVVVLAQLLRTPLYKLSQRTRKVASGINIHLQHNVSGISLLRLFGLERSDRRKLNTLLEEQLRWSVALSALQGGATPLFMLIAASGIIVVVGMGGENVVNGVWTVGVFTAYLGMFTAMTSRTPSVARVMNTWHGAKASWDRICAKLQGNNDDNLCKSEVSLRASEPLLQVNSLSFRYPFSDDSGVHAISFTAQSGEVIGITGPIGSGKSALAAALSGLFPYEGDVFVKGVPLRELKEQRSGIISYMDYEQFVFSADVVFNVALDRDYGDISPALELASMTDDITTFENGLETKLMERGLRVSGGQRQRITLARAWYGQAEILLLDDPFSAIDVSMEQRIMQNIRSSLKNRTVLLFSHRLSTFEMTDKVIVIDKGYISQIGAHHELVQHDGLYRDIYHAQRFMDTGN